ncbi:protein maelstrom homolog isoform X3 [Apis mellifera]|uniref:Protein maelstrom homolog isoform X3 n=1 Tax=Apis mellifera TaxID=7460 RepID=A0A7M7MVJ0_APIME|nr:protein maelstrom homolog isoform X3 [Apis mellifera]|eukprot:XP_026301766.1 protein maelstrom homolog isoform X3 [Apis mellifera]
MSKTAFYFFMLDWQKRQQWRGKTFNSLKDVAADPKCSEEWKNISPQDKEIYIVKAKDSKIKAQGNKKTTIGEDLSEMELNAKREQEFQQKMLEYINSVISMGLLHNNLQKLKFIFIHVNWFYKKEIGINKCEFCPAEFAVAQFSLKNGIENIYHEVLKMKIPLGWKRDAIEISQQTHQIPIELEEGQSDFSYMFSELIKFLETNKTGNKFPPLFTTKNLIPVVESLLIKMVEVNNGSVNDFLIYSIEALFGALRNAAVQKVDNRSIPLIVAENEFSKDFLCNIRGFECDISKEYKNNTSKQNYSNDQRQCNEIKPLDIIDHCKASTSTSQNLTLNISTCSMRIPNTIPQTLIGVQENIDPCVDFPPIGGRGINYKRKITNIKLPLGKGKSLSNINFYI